MTVPDSKFFDALMKAVSTASSIPVPFENVLATEKQWEWMAKEAGLTDEEIDLFLKQLIEVEL